MLSEERGETALIVLLAMAMVLSRSARLAAASKGLGGGRGLGGVGRCHGVVLVFVLVLVFVGKFGASLSVEGATDAGERAGRSWADGLSADSGSVGRERSRSGGSAVRRSCSSTTTGGQRLRRPGSNAPQGPEARSLVAVAERPTTAPALSRPSPQTQASAASSWWCSWSTSPSPTRRRPRGAHPLRRCCAWMSPVSIDAVRRIAARKSRPSVSSPTPRTSST